MVHRSQRIYWRGALLRRSGIHSIHHHGIRDTVLYLFRCTCCKVLLTNSAAKTMLKPNWEFRVAQET